MGDANGRLESPMSNPLTDSISPPSLKDEKCERGDNLAFRHESPLLDTELLPTDDHSNCPYCHRSFRMPRVLDCLHSMCEDCIIAQLDGRREAQKAHELSNRDTDFELEAPKVRERPTPPGVIRCPICSQESHVGNDVRYVYSMLRDFVRFNENEDESRKFGDRRCRACISDQTAVAFCKQCQSDLCSNCLTAHAQMRMFDGHEAVIYNELELMSDRKEIRAVLCPQHHHPYKVLCATCENLACKVCLDIEHLSHKVIDVNERVVNAIEQEIRMLVKKLDTEWRNSLEDWSRIPDRNYVLNEQYENAKAKIEMNFEQLSQALEEAKQRKLKELEDNRHKQEQSIEDLYRKYSYNETRVNDALSFTRNLLEKANGMELLVSRRKVVQQLNNLNHTMPALGIQAELEYQPMNRKQVDAQLNSICGTVSARMVASAKEPNPLEQISRTPADPNVGPIEWPRLNGNTASAPNLPAIGTERKKAARGSTDTYNGWPPSSNPPDLPSISPPLTKPDTMPVPPIPGGMPGTTAGLAFNNAYQIPSWLGPGPPPPARSQEAINAYNEVMRQRLTMALMEKANQSETASAAAAALLLQQTARIRAAALQTQQNNPYASIPSGLGPAFQTNPRGHVDDPLNRALNAMNISNPTPFEMPIGSRLSPQELREGRATELKIHSVFGTSQPGSSIRELHCPSGFCLSETDDILIADTNNHRVTVCGPPAPWKIGKPGTEDGMLCFPRKVVALKGDIVRYVVLDKGADGKTRAQIFDNRGEFQKRINLANLAPIVPRGGIEVPAATCTNSGQLVLVDTCSTVFVIDVDTPRIVNWFDASSQLGEGSDVAVYEKYIYITDFKNHCVQVFSIEGAFIRKLGEPSQTPYPIGIDISKNGDILVADTHGNHLHVVVFSIDGTLVQSFTHNEFRLSRCVGLRVAGSGHIVTLCKHNHTLFVFKPLYIR